MSKYIYHRCSTEQQEFLQQKLVVSNYLKGLGVDASTLTSVVEKVSGSVKAEDRKLKVLLDMCKEGDEIYISELSRLGRNMVDLFKTVNDATAKGVAIIQCKDGTRIEMNSIGSKALMFALSLAAEIELANIRQRTKAGLDALRAQGNEVGGTKALWGKNTYESQEEAERAREESLNKAREASNKKLTEKARKNKNNIEMWKAIELWEAKFGTVMLGRSEKATDFEKMAEWMNKRGLKTSTGMPFNKSRCRKSVLICKNIYGGCNFNY